MPSDFERLEMAVIARLRCMEKADFASLPDISEGLENRMYQACQTALNLEELYDGIKSKRYSHARIRRLVVSAFLQIPASLPKAPPYFRILSRNETGRQVLHTSFQNRRIPIPFPGPGFFGMQEKKSGSCLLWSRKPPICLPLPFLPHQPVDGNAVIKFPNVNICSQNPLDFHSFWAYHTTNGLFLHLS